jgi:hypothetical protein
MAAPAIVAASPGLPPLTAEIAEMGICSWPKLGLVSNGYSSQATKCIPSLSHGYEGRNESDSRKHRDINTAKSSSVIVELNKKRD